jgi:predicted metal-dependent peptidase
VSEPTPAADLAERAVAKAKTALRVACASLPHLAGLARAVRLIADDRVPTAAITQSGRLLLNPQWVSGLDLAEAAFVMAHELLHLCLRTHERGAGTDHEVFNWAHDYIINDMLVEELNRPVPQGGLVYPGARHLSAEKIATMIRSGQVPGPRRGPRSDLAIALEEAGLLPPQPRPTGPGIDDVLSPERERELFPGASPPEDEARRRRIQRIAAKALGLGLLRDRLDEAMDRGRGDPGEYETVMDALRSSFVPPWEMALQQWMEAVAPGPRTYNRPSRRGADRTDVVLPGRKRQGWTLHIVLDTSGSMVGDIPRVLGAIAAFCEGAGVGTIHLLECDVRVTADDWVDPEELTRYKVAGMGGSDMAPAMRHLARDPEVEAVLVLTDGAIDYPHEPMPYEVLWAITEAAAARTFAPGYGKVIALAP